MTGCLYSVHHFNTGVILPAGKSETTLGVGRQPRWDCGQPGADSTGAKHACGDSAGESISKSEIFKGSFDFRLGIRNAMGPFPGAEVQWHIEAPTSPGTMEFALNLGLPAGTSFQHKIGAGWGIGAWADNSYFLEYAISKAMGRPLFFSNLRATLLATQIGEVLGDDFTKPLPSNQLMIVQTGFGLSYRLPDWILAPDFIIPQFNLTFPQIPPGEQKFRRSDIPLAQWDWNFGFGWAL